MLQDFNAEIDKAKVGESSVVWTVSDVLSVLQKVAPIWASSHPTSSQQLRFSYEEESSPEQFFVPVVWTLIVSFAGMPWDPDSITLFSPQTPTVSALDSEDVPTEPMTSTSNGTHEV